MEYGYARVSSKDQNLARQLDALNELGLESDAIFADTTKRIIFDEGESTAQTNSAADENDRMPIDNATQISPTQESTEQDRPARKASPSSILEESNLVGISNEDWLISAIENAGLEYVDKRGTGGNLWVIGDRSIVKTMGDFQKRGAHFKYRESGGKATKGRSAWWMK